MVYIFAGFHNYNSFMHETGHDLDSEASDSENEINDNLVAVKLINATNVLGYLPLGGIIGGYTRIKFFTSEDKYPLLITRIYQCVRAVFEFLSFGFLFLPIDFAVSCHRHFYVEMPDYPKRESESTKSYLEIIKRMVEIMQKDFKSFSGL